MNFISVRFIKKINKLHSHFFDDSIKYSFFHLIFRGCTACLCPHHLRTELISEYNQRDSLIGHARKTTCSNCSDPPVYWAWTGKKDSDFLFQNIKFTLITCIWTEYDVCLFQTINRASLSLWRARRRGLL